MNSLIETAGHVPIFEANDIKRQKLYFSDHEKSLEIYVPILSSSQCQDLCKHVSANSNNFLKRQTTNNIIELIDKAIERLLNRNDPYRQKIEKLLPIVTGFSSEVIKLGLTDYLKTFRKPQLARFVAEDFSNPKILDEFQPIIKGGFAKAFGPDILFHIWAGNVPGLPLWSIISGLLVKAGNIVKVSSAEPLFASLFVKLLILQSTVLPSNFFTQVCVCFVRCVVDNFLWRPMNFKHMFINKFVLSFFISSSVVFGLIGFSIKSNTSVKEVTYNKFSSIPFSSLINKREPASISQLKGFNSDIKSFPIFPTPIIPIFLPLSCIPPSFFHVPFLSKLEVRNRLRAKPNIKPNVISETDLLFTP